MAKRPQNHITGDNAVRKIASDLIPEEWTISIPDADYGLDMLIEVVRDNHTTGRFFFIQSKGTEESSTKGKISYSLNTEKIKDYSDVKLPVLFVYYSRTENKFWGRWMNSLYSTLTDEQKGQKTISLHFSTDNEIDADYLRSIGDDITPSISYHISLTCDDLPEQFSRFHTQLLDTAHGLISSDITADRHLSCVSLSLSYVGTLQDGSVELRRGSDVVRFPIHFASHELLYYPPLAMDECPECFLEIFFVIALFGAGVSSESFHFALTYPRQEVIDDIPFNVWYDFLNQASCKDVHLLSTLFDETIKGYHYDLAQLIVLAVLTEAAHDKNCEEFYRGLICRFLSSVQDEHTKGLLSYNLANSSRVIDLYEAFSLYYKAIQYEPTYRCLYYWWQEVGGVLYLTKHYYFAELFYKKARRLSLQACKEDINMLISDCLICQGKLNEALTEESIYIKSHHQPPRMNQLKFYITEMMYNQQIKEFDNVFWFNLGVKSSQENNHEDSMYCFLFAWRLYDGDVEALVNAFIESYNVKNDMIMALVLDTLRTTSPEVGYKRIVSTILDNSDDKSHVADSLDAIKKLFF